MVLIDNRGSLSSAQYYSKNGGTYVKTGLENKVVSCVPIVIQSELKSGKKISHIWGDLTDAMREEAKKQPYNMAGHNCCSVAHKAVAAIYDGDLSTIGVNVNDFNLCGLGITWGYSLGKITDSIGLSLNSSSGFLNSSLVTVENFSCTSSEESDKEKEDI